MADDLILPEGMNQSHILDTLNLVLDRKKEIYRETLTDLDWHYSYDHWDEIEQHLRKMLLKLC